MKFKTFLFFAFLLVSNSLVANNTSLLEFRPISATLDGGACDLLPPGNFQAIEIGTNWVKYGWSPSNAQSQHRVRTFRAIDGFLLNTTDVGPGNMEVTIQDLPSEVECYGEITTICSNGDEGKSARSLNFIVLILDLIVSGYNPQFNTATCPLFGPGSCEFSNTGITAFNVVKNGTGFSRIFGMERDFFAPPTYHAHLKDPNGTEKFRFICPAGGANPPCQGPTQLEIWFHPTEGSPIRIAKFTASSTNTASNLTFIELISGYQVYQLLYKPGRPSLPSNGSIQERDQYLDILDSPLATASPNPFSEALDVKLPTPSTEQVSLSLYNLSGQKVIGQEFAGGQEQYTLPTEHLSPGFYFLRIEADGEVQTLKVIKSE